MEGAVAILVGTIAFGAEASAVSKAELPASTSGSRIAGFTKHGIDSAIFHDGVGVSERAMLDAVKNPLDVVPQSGGRLKYIGEHATVILNKAKEVITTWANDLFGRRIK